MKGSKRNMAIIFVMLVIFSMTAGGCASAPPTRAESPQSWGIQQQAPPVHYYTPAPPAPEPKLAPPVVTTPACNFTVSGGDNEGRQILVNVLSKIWGCKGKAIGPNKGKEYFISGPQSEKTVKFLPETLRRLEAVSADSLSNESLNSICPTQTGRINEAMGPIVRVVTLPAEQPPLAPSAPVTVKTGTNCCSPECITCARTGKVWGNKKNGKYIEVVQPAGSFHGRFVVKEMLVEGKYVIQPPNRGLRCFEMFTDGEVPSVELVRTEILHNWNYNSILVDTWPSGDGQGSTQTFYVLQPIR